MVSWCGNAVLTLALVLGTFISKIFRGGSSRLPGISAFGSTKFSMTPLFWMRSTAKNTHHEDATPYRSWNTLAWPSKRRAKSDQAKGWRRGCQYTQVLKTIMSRKREVWIQFQFIKVMGISLLTLEVVRHFSNLIAKGFRESESCKKFEAAGTNTSS